jgi:hypothetical protein
MSKERLKITQPLCVTAKFMLDKGGTVTETAQLLGISQSTLSRIQAADFDAEKYATQLEARRAEDQRKREEQKQAEDQVPGQMEMELPAKKNEEECHAVPYKVLESMIYDNTMKLIQCFCGKNEANNLLLQKQMDNLSMKLTTINDNLCQLIRCMRKE